MARLIVSPEADADLDAIAAFIAEHDGATRAATIAERIRKTMDNLAFMPGMGRRRSYLRRDQRAFPVPPWTIYYEPLPDGGIEVVRVLDGRRDLASVFKKKRRRPPPSS